MKIKEQSKDELKEEIKKCPSDKTHTFENDLPVLSFCACHKWQIMELLSPIEIRCVNIHGDICDFYMSEDAYK